MQAERSGDTPGKASLSPLPALAGEALPADLETLLQIAYRYAAPGFAFFDGASSNNRLALPVRSG
jgi:hypothetical protein